MSFLKLRALVIEDEAHVREELIGALNETVDFEVIGHADAVESGFQLISTKEADVVFLDIKLIGGDAFQLLSLLRRHRKTIPPVVINTGFRDFDNAKRVHNDFHDIVIHILNKPFWEDWTQHQASILDALYLHRQSNRLANNPPTMDPLIPLQDGRQSYMIHPRDIIQVRTGPKGQGKTEVILESFQFGCSLSLAQLMEQLPPHLIQINRFEAINLNWISLINHGEKTILLRNGQNCSIGNAFYPEICRLIDPDRTR